MRPSFSISQGNNFRRHLDVGSDEEVGPNQRAPPSGTSARLTPRRGRRQFGSGPRMHIGREGGGRPRRRMIGWVVVAGRSLANPEDDEQDDDQTENPPAYPASRAAPEPLNVMSGMMRGRRMAGGRRRRRRCRRRGII